MWRLRLIANGCDFKRGRNCSLKMDTKCLLKGKETQMLTLQKIPESGKKVKPPNREILWPFIRHTCVISLDLNRFSF